MSTRESLWRHAHRVTAGTAVGAVAVLALALPALAGQIDGHRNCSLNETVGLGSGTYSTLTHKHRYESDSGAWVQYSSPTPRTSWATIGPYKNADWRVSNGASEAMKSGSSKCVYLP